MNPEYGADWYQDGIPIVNESAARSLGSEGIIPRHSMNTTREQAGDASTRTEYREHAVPA